MTSENIPAPVQAPVAMPGVEDVARRMEPDVWARCDAAGGASGITLGDLSMRRRTLDYATAIRALFSEAFAALAQENESLKAQLLESVTDELWSAYNIGIERDGRWMDGARSEGEWLAREAGLGDGWHDAGALKLAIPDIARKVVAARVAAAAIRAQA